MTADDLAQLNGVLAAAAARRADAGDARDKGEIATELLSQAGAPPVGAVIERLAALKNNQRISS